MPRVKLFIIQFTSESIVKGTLPGTVETTVNNWMTSQGLAAGDAVSISNMVVSIGGTDSYGQFVMLLYNS